MQGVGTRRARMRRLAMLGALGAGAVLFATTGLAFLATNGTVQATITQTGSSTGGNVYTGSSLPSVPTGDTIDYVGSGSTTAAAPTWSVTQGTVTQVKNTTTSGLGDVAIIDATGGPTLVTVALTNAADMAQAYSYVNLPIELYKCQLSSTTTSCTGPGAGWKQDTTNAAFVSTPYLTFANAAYTFQVSGGADTYYEVVVPNGGSLYAYNTSNSSDLAAQFTVTAQPLG